MGDKKVEPRAVAPKREFDPALLLGTLEKLARDVPENLHEKLDPILKELHGTLDPILDRLEGTLSGADMLAIIGDRNGVIADVRGIVNAETVSVKTDKCLQCGREKGDAHARSSCAAIARLAAIRHRIDQA